MAPEDAVEEILSLEPVNPSLIPAAGTTLEALQEFWSSSDSANGMREDMKPRFSTLVTNQNGDSVLSAYNLQNTWIATVREKSFNPFKEKLGLFLTNYHMAVSTDKVRPPLVRKLYDSSLEAVSDTEPFHHVLAVGATSAAVAMQYGHQYNRFVNSGGIFLGNDDFAREFHQLFFRILGEGEDPDYHENTTIEHTAWALTGMRIDRDPNAWGGPTNLFDFWLDTIDFTDHTDAYGDTLYNFTNHHAGDLEILHHRISGTTAQEKLLALAEVAIQNDESEANMPVFIVNFFADDNMSEEKKEGIRELWRSIEPRNIVEFLRKYAISPLFHREDTFKYRTAIDRNMTIYNLNTVDNEEAHKNNATPLSFMARQGAVVFDPAHDVFGGQTSINAANNPDIFKDAYNRAVNNIGYTIRTRSNYPTQNGEQTWYKDWAKVIPKNASGQYRVGEVGEWLWNRFVGDGLKNYTILEKAYVTAFLAQGVDFGYLVNKSQPDTVYTDDQLTSELFKTQIRANENSVMGIDSSDPEVREEANLRVGLAINFITMTPFMFAK
jgi:hypothetical protein